MKDESIAVKQFYEFLTNSVKDNQSYLRQLSENYTKLQTNFENFVHNNKSQFAGMEMITDSLEIKIKNLTTQTASHRQDLDFRLAKLESDKEMKSRVGKLINSPVGVKLLTAFFVLMIGFTSFEFYKTDSPDQKKYIQALETQNAFLKSNIKEDRRTIREINDGI